MELLLVRRYKKDTYTIGKLYINGEYFCDTLEDTDRGLSSKMSLEEIKSTKVYGETAIPTGTYKINMNTISLSFKDRVWAKPYEGKLPRLLNVPGYEGVLIHVGNFPHETLGCILVGKNKTKGMVNDSKNTFNELMDILLRNPDNITITIK